MSLPELPEGYQWIVSPPQGGLSVNIGLFEDPYTGVYGPLESRNIDLSGYPTEADVVAEIEKTATAMWKRMERKVTLAGWIAKNFPPKEG
jgi:hypothetical protein